MSVELTEAVNGDESIYSDYSNIDEKESVVAELCGRKREFRILRKANKFLDVFDCNQPAHDFLHVKSIVHKTSTSLLIRPMKSGGSVSFELDIDWGKDSGPSWSGKVSGEAHDNNGNYARVSAETDSDGDHRVSVSGGHEKEDD